MSPITRLLIHADQNVHPLPWPNQEGEDAFGFSIVTYDEAPGGFKGPRELVRTPESSYETAWAALHAGLQAIMDIRAVPIGELLEPAYNEAKEAKTKEGKKHAAASD